MGTGQAGPKSIEKAVRKARLEFSGTGQSWGPKLEFLSWENLALLSKLGPT